ncbi:MAG: rRNA ((1915)-N(3))-methyltransferase RlmH [Betaproteobacteria bacterium]|jgi:23S rRNA (pseudouridine1915-N3)-methyltransferase|nr:rRNA ((1915)-N(3))-methyltransferase RlmH [Betaproteobacteria bacterium]
MKLRIVAVGHKMPDWINAGFAEYAQRMPREARIDLVEIKPATRSGSGEKLVQQWQVLEAERIRAALPARAFKIVLDERGKSLTTVDLARRIERWKHDAIDVAFVIGGADGTARELQQEADLLWSLSPLTLPHGLCRVMLAEQLYRALSLSAGHPYHRE